MEFYIFYLEEKRETDKKSKKVWVLSTKIYSEYTKIIL